MRVVGVDLSMTSTGVAEVFPDGTVKTHRIESEPPKRAKGDKTPPTMRERYQRLHRVEGDIAGIALFHPRYITSHLDYPALIVIEAPSYGSTGAGTWDRAGLWWMVVDRLSDRDRVPVIVPPKTRALWATGSGAAGKSPIAVHLSRMWPDVDPAISDDEWDALALASMGAQRLGWIPTELARHREQLARVDWPDFPAGAVA